MERRWVVLGVAAALSLAGLSCGDDDGGDGGREAGDGDGEATATTVEAPPEGLQASENGVSDSEIRIAVIADVENAARPGLFQGSVDGVRGWADYINERGGLAGRTVVVDFIDSRLSDTEARNAIIQACEQDFALVGTSALFVTNTDELTGCVDSAGNATGIPDIPVVTTEVDHQCSPVSFPVNPPLLDCSTKDDSPQTYRASAGRGFYYQDEFGDDLTGVYLYAADLKSANNANRAVAGGMQELGIEAVYETDVSALAPQSAYTPIVQEIKDQEATYANSGLDFASTVSLRKEAKLQGVTSVEVWDCTLQCYDRRLLEQGQADVEDQYVSVNFVPLEEADTNENVANFVDFVGEENADGFAIQAWVAATLFQDAVEGIVEQDGANGLTRQALLDELATFTEFDAGGMLGTTNVAERLPSGCFALLQVQGGEFVRVFPEEPATFDCKERNVVEFEADLG